MVFAVVVVIVSIVFFLLRRQLAKKNPVKLIYILFAFLVILALWGFIVYLNYQWRSTSLTERVAKLGDQKECFKDKEMIDALNDIYLNASTSLNSFGLLWKWLFWVTIGISIICLILVIIKVKIYGTPIL